jgi:hypothetical protein
MLVIDTLSSPVISVVCKEGILLPSIVILNIILLRFFSLNWNHFGSSRRLVFTPYRVFSIFL